MTRIKTEPLQARARRVTDSVPGPVTERFVARGGAAFAANGKASAVTTAAISAVGIKPRRIRLKTVRRPTSDGAVAPKLSDWVSTPAETPGPAERCVSR